jgi:hypothetical protein
MTDRAWPLLRVAAPGRPASEAALAVGPTYTCTIEAGAEPAMPTGSTLYELFRCAAGARAGMPQRSAWASHRAGSVADQGPSCFLQMLWSPRVMGCAAEPHAWPLHASACGACMAQAWRSRAPIWARGTLALSLLPQIGSLLCAHHGCGRAIAASHMAAIAPLFSTHRSPTAPAPLPHPLPPLHIAVRPRCAGRTRAASATAPS